MFASLFRLILTIVLAAAVLWFALPVAASTLGGAAVAAAGLRGEGVHVSVTADPPLKLLLLQADAVHIEAHDSTWHAYTFEVLDLTVSRLRGGVASGSIDGHLDGVGIPDGSGGTVRADTILVSRSVTNAELAIELTRDDVQAAVRRALAGKQGDLAAITLAPPDAVSIDTPAGQLLARLDVAQDGSLGLVLSAPGVPARTITLLEPGSELSIHFGSVAVSPTAVELRGTIDARTFGL